VHVVDVDNGARLVTYCIEGRAASGVVCMNGAAARLVKAGDRVIVISYAQMTPEEIEHFTPRIVLLDRKNRVREIVTDVVRITEDPELALSGEIRSAS
jgi:aspartate 1-decarboxylase